MHLLGSFIFTGGTAFWIALAAAVIAVAFGLVRHTALPQAARALILGGIVMLVLASGGAAWLRPVAGKLAVAVDISPSTHGAAYRNRQMLENRARQLAGKIPFSIIEFSTVNAEQTVYTPPAADAVLLFTDGRFELPATGAPTYPVIDPMLEDPPDARVRNIERRGANVALTVSNTGQPRALALTGMKGPTPVAMPNGSLIITRPPDGSAVATAQFVAGDTWPENDAMSLRFSPEMASRRWWVGRTNPGNEWSALTPGQLPPDSAAYLAPAVIVLENVSARDLSTTQQQRLVQYVRDLGGSIVITGGDRAFGAGEYDSSLLEAISPLASVPPTPTAHWILLADSSGSMNAQAGAATRWQLASGAVLKLLPELPADDLVSIGSFADQLRWWSTGKSVRTTRQMSLPPADITPRGPTNLEPALLRAAAEADGANPTQVLVVSDAETTIEKPDALIAAMKAKRMRPHLLAIGRGSAVGVLRRIIDATGGSFIEQLDPRQWTTAARQLMRGAMPQHLMESPIDVRFMETAWAIPPRKARPWNRTWMKDGATPLAEGQEDGKRVIVGARWQAGSGQAVALSFASEPAEAATLAEAIAQSPRDPRFAVTWDTAGPLRVSVDCIDSGTYLNGLKLELEAGTQRYPIPQVAPGRYEVSVASPRVPVIASVRMEGRAIDRTALAGRYAPEFDVIGTDHAAMRELAQRTGGQVIEPNQTTPVDFHWPRRPWDLTALLAALGAGCIAAGLLWWRWS